MNDLVPRSLHPYQKHVQRFQIFLYLEKNLKC